MKMTGTEQIDAPKQLVWEALNDPEVLRECIPGCQSLEMTGAHSMTAKVRIKIGIISATFVGDVVLSDIDAPNGCRISGEGKGGVAGFAKGGADVSLEESEGGTLLSYECNAQLGGKLAQMGSRLIDSTAKKLAGQFFSKFNDVVCEKAA